MEGYDGVCPSIPGHTSPLKCVPDRRAHPDTPPTSHSPKVLLSRTFPLAEVCPEYRDTPGHGSSPSVCPESPPYGGTRSTRRLARTQLQSRGERCERGG